MAYSKQVTKLTYYQGRTYLPGETIQFTEADELTARAFYNATQEPVPSTPEDAMSAPAAKAPRPAGKSINNNSVTEKGAQKVQVVDDKGKPVTPVVQVEPEDNNGAAQ